MAQEETLQRRIGQRMKEAAHAREMTAYALADRLAVRPPTVYRWWSGANAPSTDMLAAYAKLVEVEVSWFYEEEIEDARADDAPPTKPQVIRVLDAVMARFTAHPATLILTPPRVNADVAEYQHQQGLRQAAVAIQEAVLAKYGRGWTELTTEERHLELSELSDEVLVYAAQPPEAGSEDSE